jgi:class 3 adenylate cyclase
MRREILQKAARSQALLETAMPPVVARALLEGTPAFELARNFTSASIAFLSLEDFQDASIIGRSATDPRMMIEWLHDVFSAFDALVEAYAGKVNKVEIVANTYVVSAGLPHDDTQHALVLACFVVDVLDLCRDIPGVGPVRLRVGLHTGPVTAGLIGHTRRFYRVFGDTGARWLPLLCAVFLSAVHYLRDALCSHPHPHTHPRPTTTPAVNVTSRMMSTGDVGRIQCTAAAVDAVLRSAAPEVASARSGELNATILQAHGIAFLRRGPVFVKGKGEMVTYWLDPVDGDPSASSFVAGNQLTVQTSDGAPVAAGDKGTGGPLALRQVSEQLPLTIRIPSAGATWATRPPPVRTLSSSGGIASVQSEVIVTPLQPSVSDTRHVTVTEAGGVTPSIGGMAARVTRHTRALGHGLLVLADATPRSPPIKLRTSTLGLASPRALPGAIASQGTSNRSLVEHSPGPHIGVELGERAASLPRVSGGLLMRSGVSRSPVIEPAKTAALPERYVARLLPPSTLHGIAEEEGPFLSRKGDMQGRRPVRERVLSLLELGAQLDDERRDLAHLVKRTQQVASSPPMVAKRTSHMSMPLASAETIAACRVSNEGSDLPTPPSYDALNRAPLVPPQAPEETPSPAFASLAASVTSSDASHNKTVANREKSSTQSKSVRIRLRGITPTNAALSPEQAHDLQSEAGARNATSIIAASLAQRNPTPALFRKDKSQEDGDDDAAAPASSRLQVSIPSTIGGVEVPSSAREYFASPHPLEVQLTSNSQTDARTKDPPVTRHVLLRLFPPPTMFACPATEARMVSILRRDYVSASELLFYLQSHTRTHIVHTCVFIHTRIHTHAHAHTHS